MRLLILLTVMLSCLAATPTQASPPAVAAESAPKQINITADQSVEYYHDKNLYVARGNAKAKRGTLTVSADLLTAHEREKTPGGPKQPKNANGDLDWMTADGHVVISDPKQRITGEHAVYNLDKHTMVVTGSNLRYETAKEVVTATDSLEYYEDSKLAVARGHAVADQPTKHVEGDVLTAEFRDAPNGQSQLSKMTAQGHVAVITKSEADEKRGGDVSRGDRAVYNADSNMAILTGDVRITRKDGTELSGNVGEVDFNNNRNRLMDDGNSRVRALLPAKTGAKAKASTGASDAPAPGAP